MVGESVLMSRLPLRTAGNRSQWVSNCRTGSSTISHRDEQLGVFIHQTLSLRSRVLISPWLSSDTWKTVKHVGQIQAKTTGCPHKERPERMEGKGARQERAAWGCC